MFAATIAERIGTAINAGALRALRKESAFLPVTVLGDLLKPYEEVFPGVNPEEDREQRGLFDGYRGLRRPQFVPTPRRSGRPLAPPARIAVPGKSISPLLFKTVAAIWGFYISRDMADPELLNESVTEAGLDEFLASLTTLLDGYYPLGTYLENDFREESVLELRGLSLLLPHFTYDDEHIGIFEAFLSGPDSVHAVLDHYLSGGSEYTEEVELPAADRKLIEAVGLAKLVEAFAAFGGEKSCDLEELINWGEVYFGDAHETFNHQDKSYSLITQDSWDECTVWISCKEDIEFAIAYHDAFEKLLADMPNHIDLGANSDGSMDMFVHELCNVWRQANGKRPVKWTSPKQQRLGVRMRRGEL